MSTNNDQKAPHPCPGLADKTIANMEELRIANEKLQQTEDPAWKYRELEKQKMHVAASMARCRRCGDFAPAFPVAGILIRICSACETHLKERDGVMWFVDLLNAVAQKGKGS